MGLPWMVPPAPPRLAAMSQGTQSAAYTAANTAARDQRGVPAGDRVAIQIQIGTKRNDSARKYHEPAAATPARAAATAPPDPRSRSQTQRSSTAAGPWLIPGL